MSSYGSLFCIEGEWRNSQLGILIPAGTPLLPNANTSSEVKSGRRNLSFSYASGHGRRGRNSSALSTNVPNFALISLFTTATNPIEDQKR